MSPRRLPRRILALSLGMLLSAGVLGLACSVPDRGDSGFRVNVCTEGCPETDAATDSPTEASQIVFDGGSEQALRNVNCGGPSDCNPDPGEAAWSCQGTLVQQPGKPGSKPNPTGDFSVGGVSGSPLAQAHKRPILSCQILRKSSEAQATCVSAGSAVEGEACRGIFLGEGGAQLSDCAPGLACVRGTDPTADSITGQCRPYCCFGTGCGPGSWCTPRRLFETNTSQDPIFVPVCAPADSCALLEPSACPAGQACVLVADQTTSCDVPGKGTSGQSCPCAAGFACARDTSTCRAICRVDVQEDCPTGLCVGGGDAMPPGYGLCLTP